MQALLTRFDPEIKVVTGVMVALGVDYVNIMTVLVTDLTRQIITPELSGLILVLKLLAMFGGLLMVVAGLWSRILSIKLKRRWLRGEPRDMHDDTNDDPTND